MRPNATARAPTGSHEGAATGVAPEQKTSKPLPLAAAVQLPWSYQCVSRVWPIAGLAYCLWRARREPEWSRGLNQRLGLGEVSPADRGVIWLHAASVGEVQAVRPLVEKWLAQADAPCLLITCQTPTGLAAARSLWGSTVRLSYAPFDSPGCIERWLKRWQPLALLLVERELWPHWVASCTAHALPVILFNARLSTASERAMQRRRSWFEPVLQALTLLLAVDTQTAERLVRLGAAPERVRIAGNLKFECPAAGPVLNLPRGLSNRPILLAGSTHSEDEVWIEQAWPQILQQSPTALMLIAPRHPRRFDAVAAHFEARGWKVARRTQLHGVLDPQVQVLVLDTLGELASWYALASVCFIGGTVGAVGGHSPLEALAAGRRVCFGPNTDHFAGLYETIARVGVGVRLEPGQPGVLRLLAIWAEQACAASQITADPQVLAFMQGHQGALDRTIAAMQPVLGMWGGGSRLCRVSAGNNQACRWILNAERTTTQEMHTWFLSSTASYDPVLRTQPGSGRGQIRRARLGQNENAKVVLRHYRRGGGVARLLKDRYLFQSAAQSRGFLEFELLRQMHAQGLPVPEPVAAIQQVSGLFYRADIAVMEIAQTKNLAEVLDEQRPTARAWAQIGAVIAQFHRAGIDHVDLNVHNILLDEAGGVWLIDFDRCCRRAPGSWQQANLARLLRSLRKEQLRRPGFCWVEEDWDDLMKGYES